MLRALSDESFRMRRYLRKNEKLDGLKLKQHTDLIHRFANDILDKTYELRLKL